VSGATPSTAAPPSGPGARPPAPNHQAHQPELVRLREQLTAQRAEVNAAAVTPRPLRALEQTITTYANQIQTLALHAAELTQDNQRLREQLSRSGNLRTLPTTATTSQR
jgi:hypothetical protein